MTTKNEMIAIIKAENTNGLRIGDEDNGYTDLSPADYEAQINEWADNRLAKEAEELEAAKPLTLADKLDSIGLTIPELKTALGL